MWNKPEKSCVILPFYTPMIYWPKPSEAELSDPALVLFVDLVGDEDNDKNTMFTKVSFTCFLSCEFSPSLEEFSILLSWMVK